MVTRCCYRISRPDVQVRISSTTTSATCTQSGMAGSFRAKRKQGIGGPGLCRHRNVAIALTSTTPPRQLQPPFPSLYTSRLHQTIILIFEYRDVPYLLDASLAREHLDPSSAASARKVQSLILSRRSTQLPIDKQTSLHRQQRR
jgi:hypothetical protein